MAIEVTVDTTIERSPEAVFERIADVEAWPAWLIASGITAVRRSSPGPIARGESLVVEQVAAGRAATFAAAVAALEVPSRLVVSGRDDDGISIEIEATLAPTDGTSGTATALRWTIRIGLPFRRRVFEGMARPQVERAVALDLEALRRRLESTAPD
jgi:uncharacterized protein YndB with AHSA1/START domain